MYVYRIKFPDGKSYIGSTRNFKARRNAHTRNARNNKSEKVYAAIRKFGIDSI